MYRNASQHRDRLHRVQDGMDVDPTAATVPTEPSAALPQAGEITAASTPLGPSAHAAGTESGEPQHGGQHAARTDTKPVKGKERSREERAAGLGAGRLDWWSARDSKKSVRVRGFSRRAQHKANLAEPAQPGSRARAHRKHEARNKGKKKNAMEVEADATSERVDARRRPRVVVLWANGPVFKKPVASQSKSARRSTRPKQENLDLPDLTEAMAATQI
ncbi:hypothetical protein H9P43_002815 [Blastocladiella emersonii ATCC 22665]|nr:hypothetical protein H9P43_002815 [Blastocladiella emersonii ATCC 22665]